MSDAPVLIRPAKRGDWAAIVRLVSDDELRVQNRAHVTLTDAQRAAFEDIAADPNNHVYVATLDGQG